MRDTEHQSGKLTITAAAIIPVAAAAIVGTLATIPNLAGWYAALVKPSFNPPDIVFGPVWAALYLLMIVAVWRILRQPRRTRGRALALVYFYVQLALNAAWPWMFFAAQEPLLGVVNIIPQWLLIVATIATFNRLDRPASWCLVPLALWVAFAAVLNIAIWQLNP